MAACRTPCCSNSSPPAAPVRWSRKVGNPLVGGGALRIALVGRATRHNSTGTLDEMQALSTVYQIIAMLTNILVMLIIIQFIIGLLFAFNVVNRSNDFLASFYMAINRFLEPVLRPIRNILPNTGAIDFSPLVLIILLNVVLIVLGNVIHG
jgi:YggT family protein